MITYFISISLSNINLLYISLFENIPLTRDFRKTDIFLFKENLIFTLSNLSSYPIFFVKNAFEKNLYIPFFFLKIPLFLTNTLALFLIFFATLNKKKLFLVFLIFIFVAYFVEYSFTFNYVKELTGLGIVQTIQTTRIQILLVFLTFFLIINANFTTKTKFFNKKNLSVILILIIFFFYIFKIYLCH